MACLLNSSALSPVGWRAPKKLAKIGVAHQNFSICPLYSPTPSQRGQSLETARNELLYQSLIII